MPHADIKYSPNLRFEPQKVFAAIEDTINAHDSDAGYSKCRSYPAKNSNHTHLLIEVSMLTKPHQNTTLQLPCETPLKQQSKCICSKGAISLYQSPLPMTSTSPMNTKGPQPRPQDNWPV